MPDLAVIPMAERHLSLGLALSTAAGWNQTPSDWRRMWMLSGRGAWVGLCDGCEVATTMTFTFGPIAWLAMVLVNEQARGRGMARRLLKHAIADLEQRGVQSIRLDATEFGKPVYEKLGFASQFEVVRWQGTARSPARPATNVPASVALDPAVAPLPTMAALDQQVTATARGTLLEQLLATPGARCRVQRDDTGQLVGFALSRPGRIASQIGPCISRNAGAALLSDMLTDHAGREVIADLPADREDFAGLARQAGLQPARRFTRMTRGVMVEEDLAALVAGSGPEKG